MVEPHAQRLCCACFSCVGHARSVWILVFSRSLLAANQEEEGGAYVYTYMCRASRHTCARVHIPYLLCVIQMYHYSNNIKTESQETDNYEQVHGVNIEEIDIIENENVDEHFRPRTPELISEMNSQIQSLTKNDVAPLKPRYELSKTSLINYVTKKRTEIVTSFSDMTNAKLQKMYHVSNDEQPKAFAKPSCSEWIYNFAIALKNSSSISEKIRLLTLLPKIYTKSQILNYFPDVTAYMINKARKMVKTKGIYS